jgi:glycine oxidase
LDTRALLNAGKAYFQEQNAYHEATFDYDDLEIMEEGVRWKGIRAKKVVFCEGARGESNPFFKHLDFKNAMGEIVALSCDRLPKNTILNHGKWLCPMDDEGSFKYGATSYWEDTEAARRLSETQIQDSLHAFLKVPYTIQGILHGVRPVLKSRVPFAGSHPNYPQLYMINGLGGQGCSKAPLVVMQFSTEKNAS